MRGSKRGRGTRVHSLEAGLVDWETKVAGAARARHGTVGTVSAVLPSPPITAASCSCGLPSLTRPCYFDHIMTMSQTGGVQGLYAHDASSRGAAAVHRPARPVSRTRPDSDQPHMTPLSTCQVASTLSSGARPKQATCTLTLTGSAQCWQGRVGHQGPRWW